MLTILELFLLHSFGKISKSNHQNI
jgi:hypothetical protein